MPCLNTFLRLPTLVLATGLVLVPLARAADHADAHGGAAPASMPAAAKPAAEVKGSVGMDELREKLATRLGATRATDSKHPDVLRVANKAEGPAEPPRRAPAKAAAAGHASPAAAQLLPHAAHDAHWEYEGAHGPEHWGSMKPEFAACASGERQSPIDIRDGLPLELQPIEFDYHPSSFAVLDNGHTVQVNLPPGNGITLSGRRFELLQFHFHRPSEERINGRQFDMVAHLVHKDAAGKLAVVAVLLEHGSAHPLIQSVWNALPLEKGVAEPAPTTLDLTQLLPKDRRYYTYMGSLTTPPCSEGVLWMVLKEPVPLSELQIGIFARLYPMNARPIQKVSGRLIKDGQ